MTHEDQLYYCILMMVDQACGTDDGLMDSQATSAYERAIDILQEAGFLTCENQGRMGGRITEKGRGLIERMEAHELAEQMEQLERDRETLKRLGIWRKRKFGN